MFFKSWLTSIVLSGLLILPGAVSSAVVQATASPVSYSNKQVMTQLVALTDAFVRQIKTEGFQPSLPPPKIVLDNPPSLGAYDDEKNILHVAAWNDLPPEQRALFAGMAGQGKTEQQAFDESVYHWVFIHELSHWWQACEHKSQENHYSAEYGAYRLAAAYWRLKDPIIADLAAQRAAAFRGAMPNPVPAGQQKEKYFNQNYDQLGPTPAYLWFQSDMILSVVAERPLPSFRQTLQQPLFPQ